MSKTIVIGLLGAALLLTGFVAGRRSTAAELRAMAPAPALPPSLATAQPESAPRERIARAFSSEKSDPTWAQQAQRTAEARLRRNLPAGVTLRAVECRTSLCRIETTHENMDVYQRFVEMAFMKMDTQVWNGASFSTPVEADGAERGFPVAIVSYLAREGRALPQLQ